MQKSVRARSSGVERSVRNGKAAGANPAESTKLFGKEFYQKAPENSGGKPASGSGAIAAGYAPCFGRIFINVFMYIYLVKVLTK